MRSILGLGVSQRRCYLDRRRHTCSPFCHLSPQAWALSLRRLPLLVRHSRNKRRGDSPPRAILGGGRKPGSESDSFEPFDASGDRTARESLTRPWQSGRPDECPTSLLVSLRALASTVAFFKDPRLVPVTVVQNLPPLYPILIYALFALAIWNSRRPRLSRYRA